MMADLSACHGPNRGLDSVTLGVNMEHALLAILAVGGNVFVTHRDCLSPGYTNRTVLTHATRRIYDCVLVDLL